MEENIHIWLDLIEHEAIVPQDIVALNFGIYETEKGYCIYIVGACEYNETDDSWAEDAEALSREFFLEIESQNDWKLFQKQVEHILSNELKQRSTITSSPFYNKIITTGFDDGSLTRIV